jgi:hypothetical protein
MVCTPTEAVFVQLDIESGAVTAANQPDTAAAGCYACLVADECLDSNRVHNQECGDLDAAFTNGSNQMLNGPDTCVATLQCMTNMNTNQNCVNNTDGLSYCYCGPGGEAPGCTTAAGGAAANGACLSAQVAGFPYAQDDSADIVNNFTALTVPSGLANSILGCASLNGCTACLP